MRVDVLTIFPEMFSGFLATSIIKRAREQGQLAVNLVDIRNYARNKHRNVDDYPFGGGPGMVMMAEPLFLAVEDLLAGRGRERRRSFSCRPRVQYLSKPWQKNWLSRNT